MSYTGVHQLVRYKLKAKLKVPRPVHIKQEVGIVEDFKKKRLRTSSANFKSESRQSSAISGS